MRYAFVSDIHANMVAWQAVLADLRESKVDKIICLGDIVGYGPQPQEVLMSVYRHADAVVMGNHDAVVCGKLTSERFNDLARRMVEWSGERLSKRSKEFLSEASLTVTGEGFVAVHGEVGQPEAFRYIFEPEDTLATWDGTDRQIVFVGHTHHAGMFVRGASGQVHHLPPEDFILEDGKRYIVNVGSVGFPRDGDPRASYCIYDSAEKTVYFRRVVFDRDELRLAYAKAGLDEMGFPLLSQGVAETQVATLDTLGFAPAVTADQMAWDVAHSQDLASLRHSREMWRWTAIAGVLVAALVAGAAVTWGAKWAGRSGVSHPSGGLKPREAVIAADLAGNLNPALPEVTDGESLDGWRVTFLNPKHQHLEMPEVSVLDAPILRIVHSQRSRLIIEAPLWELYQMAEGRVQVRIDARRSSEFKGTLKIVVGLEERSKPPGGSIRERVVINYAVPLNKVDNWHEGRRTMDKRMAPLSGLTKSLYYRIEAEFTGVLDLANPTMSIVP